VNERGVNMRADISTEDIAADYRNGLSMSKIASRYDTCVGVVQARLEKAGVQPRARSWRTDARYVSEQELQAFSIYSDPAYEARHGIVDQVICRLCGRYLKVRVAYHLRDCHNTTPKEYLRQFPGARLSTFTCYARAYGRDAQNVMQDFAADFATPKEVADCRRDPAYEARHRIAEHIMCRMCGRWLGSDQIRVHLRTHRDAAGDRLTLAKYRELYPAAPASSYQRLAQKMGNDVHEVMKGVIDWFVTPVQREECQHNPTWESGHGITDFVVCRKCGSKLMSNPPRHFRTQHGIEVEQYLEIYPQAPLKVPREVTKIKQAQDKFRKKLARAMRLAMPKPRGKPKGSLSPDTQARVTIIADCLLKGMKPYQIAPHAYPLHQRQNDAWKALEKCLDRQSAAIAQMEVDLPKLSEAEYLAVIEAAKKTLRS
jgi:predicted transcriptional regulator